MLILNRRSSLQSGFILEKYFVHKRYRLHRGMTKGAVGYSANFEFPQLPTAWIHRNIRITLGKRKRKENPFSLEIWGIQWAQKV